MSPMYLDDLVDNLDAAFFSGDSLFTPDNYAEMTNMLARWQRRMVEIKEIIDEIEGAH